MLSSKSKDKLQSNCHLTYCSFSCFSDGKSNKCDSGYTLLPSGCYLKTGKIKNRNDGVKLCKEMGGHLVTLDSSEEQSDVIGLVGDDAQGNYKKES